MATNNEINVPIETIATAGANSNITSLTGLTGTIRAPTNISSSAGLVLITFNYAASAVNNFIFGNNSTGNSPYIQSTGSDSTVGFNIVMKNGSFSVVDSTATAPPAIRWTNAAQTHFIGFKAATGVTVDIDFTWPAADGSANFLLKTNGSGALSFANGSQIAGTATNDNASTGNIGEFLSSIIPTASAVAISTNTNTNLTFVDLTTGDWDVWANLTINSNNSNATVMAGWLSSTSATLPDASLYGIITMGATGLLGSFSPAVPSQRFTVNTTTRIYLTGLATFTTGAGNMTGGIYARRRR